MPCYDGTNGDNAYRHSRYTIAFLESSLCAVVRALQRCDDTFPDDSLRWVDFEEAGVDNELFKQWVTEHFARDQERIARERKALYNERARQIALSKLTPEEIELLGIEE